MALSSEWNTSHPLHENHPDFLERESQVTQSTQKEGPFFHVITNKGILRFAHPLAVNSVVEVIYTYNPGDMTIDESDPMNIVSTLPDLPAGYHELILDIATRNMFSTPGDDTRAGEWADIVKEAKAALFAVIKYRRQVQAQREARRERFVQDTDGQEIMVIDHIEGPSQPREGVKTT